MAKKGEGKKYELHGEYHTLPEWCKKYSVATSLVRGRINTGWDLETALTLPVTTSYLREKRLREMQQSPEGIVPDMELNRQIAEDMIELRHSTGLSREDIYKISGISTGTLYAKERNRVYFTIRDIEILCKLYKVKVALNFVKDDTADE